MGRPVTGIQRIRWSGEVDQDTSRQPVSQRCARSLGDVGGTVEELVLLCQISADQIPARADARAAAQALQRRIQGKVHFLDVADRTGKIQVMLGQKQIGDVGWNNWEEINTGRGLNFGWPCFEGDDPEPARPGSTPRSRGRGASP